MCALCKMYGVEPIADPARLKRALETAACLLGCADKKQTDHVMQFIDNVTGKDADFDPERDGAWEAARRYGNY